MSLDLGPFRPEPISETAFVTAQPYWLAYSTSLAICRSRSAF